VAKYIFQFEDEIDSKRQCRLAFGCLTTSVCAVVSDDCEGKLFDRPEWCPLTVIHEHEKPDDR
jgi:hypothetical protein